MSLVLPTIHTHTDIGLVKLKADHEYDDDTPLRLCVCVVCHIGRETINYRNDCGFFRCIHSSTLNKKKRKTPIVRGFVMFADSVQI